MHFECLKIKDLTPDDWRDWTALRNASPIYDDPFLDPEYARLVADVRSDVRVAIVRDSGEMVAAWPLHWRPGGWTRPIGGPFSDWHGPILADGAELDAGAILQGVKACGMTTFGLTAKLGQVPDGLERVQANMTCLRGGFEAFQKNQTQIYPKHFKKIRRMQRNMTRDFTDIVYTFDDEDPAAFADLIRLKQEQFARTGKHDVLAPEWVRSLFKTLRTHRTPRFRARLSTLRLDGRLAAAEFNLESDTVVHGWITAFDQEFSYYSPGYMLVDFMLEKASDIGILQYDSGCDLDYYKKYYSNFTLPLDRGVIRTGQFSPAPSRLLGNLWGSLETAIPGKVGGLMGKVRRRSDQILNAEMSLPARAAGFANAARPSRK